MTTAARPRVDACKLANELDGMRVAEVRPWFDDAHDVTTREVAEALGMTLGRQTLGPCLACGAAQRGSSDARLPLLAGRGGWSCVRCGAKGGGMDLVLRAIATWNGEDKPSGEHWRIVRVWYAEHGWCDPEGAAPGDAPRRIPRAARVEPPRRPDAEVLAELWGLCGPVVDPEADLWRPLLGDRAEGDVATWLHFRGLDPALVAERNLARALPWLPQTPPGLRRFGGGQYLNLPEGRSWYELGYRLAVPLYNAEGRMASLHGRCVTLPAERPPVLYLVPADGTKPALEVVKPPKGTSMTGYDVSGLVMADALGRELLATRSRPAWWPPEVPLRVIVAEGEPDFLLCATLYRDDDVTAPAVLGIVAGSWTPAIAERIPDGTRVIVATDGDKDGDKYAEDIRRTLAGRCDLRRVDVRALTPRERQGDA